MRAHISINPSLPIYRHIHPSRRKSTFLVCTQLFTMIKHNPLTSHGRNARQTKLLKLELVFGLLKVYSRLVGYTTKPNLSIFLKLIKLEQSSTWLDNLTKFKLLEFGSWFPPFHCVPLTLNGCWFFIYFYLPTFICVLAPYIEGWKHQPKCDGGRGSIGGHLLLYASLLPALEKLFIDLVRIITMTTILSHLYMPIQAMLESLQKLQPSVSL